MFNHCCFCISLQIGCYIIGSLFLLGQVINIVQYSSLLPYLGPDEREDQENRDARERVKTRHIVWIVVSVLFCSIGVCIIVAAFMERPLVLKVLAVLIFVPTIANVLGIAIEGRHPIVSEIVGMMISLGIYLYCALILWSFAKQIETPEWEVPVSYIPSYPQTGYPQQFGAYPSQQQLGNRDQNIPNYPGASPYQPYGYRHGNWPWPGHPVPYQYGQPPSYSQPVPPNPPQTPPQPTTK